MFKVFATFASKSRKSVRETLYFFLKTVIHGITLSHAMCLQLTEDDELYSVSQRYDTGWRFD